LEDVEFNLCPRSAHPTLAHLLVASDYNLVKVEMSHAVAVAVAVVSCQLQLQLQLPIAQALKLEDKLEGATNFRGTHLYMFKSVSLS